MLARHGLLVVCILSLTGCLSPLRDPVPREPEPPALDGQAFSTISDPADDPPTPEPEPVVATSQATESSPPPPPAKPRPKAKELWPRLRQGLRLRKYYHHPRVAAQRQRYLANPRQFTRLMANAKPYLPHIVKQAEAMNLPLELALLPAIESNFDPFAYSHRHASGLWQFTPGTGKLYGLRVDDWVDQRRDVVASTRAALRYLKRLYRVQSQDWLSAIAAYNCGEGTMAAARASNLAANQMRDYWSLDLPQETMHFVPRLLAVASLVAQPERFRVKLPSLPDRRSFQATRVPYPIQLPLIAEWTEQPMDQVRRLNPALLRDTVHPNQALFLPPGKIATLRERLAKVSPDSEILGKRQTHTVRAGDSLWRIARQYDSTVARLRQWNGLSRRALLQPGATLLIPPREAPSQVVTQEPRAESGKSHVIRSGDTLWAIARRYGTNIAALRAANDLAPRATLRLGRQLIIPD